MNKLSCKSSDRPVHFSSDVCIFLHRFLSEQTVSKFRGSRTCSRRVPALTPTLTSLWKQLSALPGTLPVSFSSFSVLLAVYLK